VLRKEPDAAETAADTRTREEGNMKPEQAAKLREKFPPEAIGKLPKGGVTLDYVGHAAVTDRLLQVDPEWTWEPFAEDANGLPALDRANNLWIRLTVGGVTRIGVGDGKNAKECISDAIRNAAMRFGVALDLWAKEDLDALHQQDSAAANRPTAGAPPASGGGAQPSPPPPSTLLSPREALVAELEALAVAWKALKPEWNEGELTKWLGAKPRSEGELTAAIDTYTANIAAARLSLAKFPIPETAKGKAA
jgi:hypothetical protein